MHFLHKLHAVGITQFIFQFFRKFFSKLGPRSYTRVVSDHKPIIYHYTDATESAGLFVANLGTFIGLSTLIRIAVSETRQLMLESLIQSTRLFSEVFNIGP